MVRWKDGWGGGNFGFGIWDLGFMVRVRFRDGVHGGQVFPHQATVAALDVTITLLLPYYYPIMTTL